VRPPRRRRSRAEGGARFQHQAPDGHCDCAQALNGRLLIVADQIRACRKEMRTNNKGENVPSTGRMRRIQQMVLSNLFNIVGNFMFCSPSIIEATGLSGATLTRLREHKRSALETVEVPVRDMRRPNPPYHLSQIVLPDRALGQDVHSWLLQQNLAAIVQVVRNPEGVAPVHPFLGKTGVATPKGALYTPIKLRFIGWIHSVMKPNGRTTAWGIKYYLYPQYVRVVVGHAKDASVNATAENTVSLAFKAQDLERLDDLIGAMPPPDQQQMVSE